MVRSGEVSVAMGWDNGGWKLNAENADIDFVAPKSGALGWIDTFVIPAKAKNVEAAYQWINFILQPENAAVFTNKEKYGTASKDAGKFLLYKDTTFPEHDIIWTDFTQFLMVHEEFQTHIPARLKNLTKSEFNGSIGTIDTYNPKSNRFEFKLNSERTIWVKVSNIDMCTLDRRPSEFYATSWIWVLQDAIKTD